MSDVGMRNTQALWIALIVTTLAGGLLFVQDVAKRALHEHKQRLPPLPPIYSDLWPKDFGAIVTVRIGTYTFKVPEKYFYYGKKPEDRGKIKNSLSYVFWYPDLSPTFYRQAYRYNRRPTEPGRAAPSFQESIVTAGRVSEIPDPKNPFPLEEKLTRTIRLFGGENGRFVKQDHSVYTLDFYKDRKNEENYYFLDDDLIQRMVQCIVGKRYRNKNCDSIIYIKQSKISLGISFVADQLPNWREIEQAAITLLDRFMIKTPEHEQRK